MLAIISFARHPARARYYRSALHVAFRARVSSMQASFAFSAVVALGMLLPLAVEAQTAAMAPANAQSPDTAEATAMSLADARDIIQRGQRFQWSDGAADHSPNSLEFDPKQMVDVSYNADGTRSVYPGCPYETFKPHVDPQVLAFANGTHKGEPLFRALGGDWCKVPGEYLIEVHLPTPEQAHRVTVALLRWHLSTLAEREAMPELEQQQFAPVAASYRAQKTKPAIGEDVRRYKIAAEVAVQDKRFSDAADAYEDGLKLAPWWPEGQFNMALLLGGLHYYDEAVSHMKKYLALVPDAPDARAAQDKIYAWESRRQAEFQ